MVPLILLGTRSKALAGFRATPRSALTRGARRRDRARGSEDWSVQNGATDVSGFSGDSPELRGKVERPDPAFLLQPRRSLAETRTSMGTGGAPGQTREP